MSERQGTWLLTTGTGSAYRVVARLQGPATPGILKLYEEFLKRYQIPEPAGGGRNPSTRQALATIDMVEAKFAAMVRLKESGYPEGCYSLATFFLLWLEREHGYKELPLMEVHVDD